MRPTIRGAILVDYVAVARSVGLDPYRMLGRFGLPRSCLRNPDLRISADAVAELLEASASTARVEDFGLRLAQRRGLSNLGPLALIVREQPTVRKAIEVLIQYIALHTDALSPRLEEKDRVVTISRMLSGQGWRTRQALELAVGVSYRILKTFPNLHEKYRKSSERNYCLLDRVVRSSSLWVQQLGGHDTAGRVLRGVIQFVNIA